MQSAARTSLSFVAKVIPKIPVAFTHFLWIIQLQEQSTRTVRGPQKGFHFLEYTMKAGRASNAVEVVSQKPERLSLFDHLPKKLPTKNSDLVEGDRILHPATIKLGALYSKGMIQADDDRVTSLVAVFCNLIQDYKTPPKKVRREDLDKYNSKQVIDYSGHVVWLYHKLKWS